MSSSTAKPPLRDPVRPPSAEEVDLHLGPFSRYARTVRGAARVSGLSCKLTWTPQGWIECLKWEESLIGNLVLVRVPPVAQVGVSKTGEEMLLASAIPEPVKQAIRAAPGQNVKWVEIPLVGLESADHAASLVSTKAEMIRSGRLPLSQAERIRTAPKPDLDVIDSAPSRSTLARAKPSPAKASARKPAAKSKPKARPKSVKAPARRKPSAKAKPARAPKPKGKKKASGSRR